MNAIVRKFEPTSRIGRLIKNTFYELLIKIHPNLDEILKDSITSNLIIEMIAVEFGETIVKLLFDIPNTGYKDYIEIKELQEQVYNLQGCIFELRRTEAREWMGFEEYRDLPHYNEWRETHPYNDLPERKYS